MTLMDWWKLEQYWIRGGIIGLTVVIFLSVIFALSSNAKCVEAPSCTEYLSLSVIFLILFGPIGIFLGIVVGYIVDMMKK